MTLFRSFIFLIALSSTSVYSIQQATFSTQQFYENTKFIGLVEILSGEVQKNSEGITCAVKYTANVIQGAFGKKSNEVIKFHHLVDIRKSFLFSPLEVGSDYFIYAEDKSTHKFLQLGDGLYRFPEYPKECHASDNSLYIYREFTGKIKTRQGMSYVDTYHLYQINELILLPKVYSSKGANKYVIDSRHPNEAYKDGLHAQGFEINNLIEFFRNDMLLHSESSKGGNEDG